MLDCSSAFSQQCCQDGAYYKDMILKVNTYLQKKYKKMQIYYKYRVFNPLNPSLKPLVALF
jgi:hypothetical protein